MKYRMNFPNIGSRTDYFDPQNKISMHVLKEETPGSMYLSKGGKMHLLYSYNFN